MLIAHFTIYFCSVTPPTAIYALSLHDALPIWIKRNRSRSRSTSVARVSTYARTCRRASTDRKSTRLNSSHLVISYAVFCLKKKIYHHPLQSPQKSSHLQLHTHHRVK